MKTTPLSQSYEQGHRVESQVTEYSDLFEIIHHCMSSLELNVGKIFLISPLPYWAFQGVMKQIIQMEHNKFKNPCW